MPGSIVCNVCGGKDFYNEAGFYFCNECQTQTQEIREQVFDQQDNTAFLRVHKTTVRQNKSFSQVKLTSWEIFNHILYGLVEELSTLGVNKDFKEVCYHLWILYLTKLEILSKVPDGLPKLNACFRQRDAEIIFNRSFSRKRKKNMSASESVISKSSNSSANDLEMKMIHKERTKLRRKLVRAEYDEYSNTKSSETSIHNQTLSTLGSEDESVASSTGSQLVFTKTAKKELLKIMSREHLTLHINDVENKLKCHKLSQRLFNQAYKDANIVTRNKLYAIIYIALRLTQDQYQLSDIIRFCREGHLSFIEYKHFFPDVLTENCIDDSVYSKGAHRELCSMRTRQQAWSIYQLLELKQIDISPDLIVLCRRYCTELNLPDDIFNLSANFIKLSQPKFKLNENTKIFHNHEGRAMAFIMYTLKVLFGFDGATEYEFSKFGKLLNKKLDKKMFVFDDWYNYIQYRKLLLKKVHFPTKFQLDPNNQDSVDLYLKFTKQRRMLRNLEDEETATLSMKIAKKYLNELEIFQDNSENLIEFKASVTPFRSYLDEIQNIPDISDFKVNQEILRDRSAETINFIINYSRYLKNIKSSKCEIKHSGKNTKHVFYKIRKNNWEIFDVHVNKWHKSFHKDKMEILHFDHLLNKILHKQKQNTTSQKKKTLVERLNKSEPIIRYVEKKQITLRNTLGRDNKGRFCKKDSAQDVGLENFQNKSRGKGEWFVSSWKENPLLKQHKYNPSLTYQVYQDVESKEGDADADVEMLDSSANSLDTSKKNKKLKYPTHYCPWLEYWINVQEFNTKTSAEKWDAFYSTLPKNFRWLLRECAAVIEQRPIDLFIEFVNVELYMCYVHVGNTPVLNKYCDNYKTLTKLIQKVKDVW